MVEHCFLLSVEYTDLTDEEVKWFSKTYAILCDCVYDLGGNPEDLPQELKDIMAVEYEEWSLPVVQAKDGTVWIYHNEGFTVDAVATLLRAFLVAFPKPGREWLGFEWAETCSSIKVGSFGGGACIVTADGWTTMTTGQWIEEQAADFAV